MELSAEIRERMEQLDSTTYNHSFRVWRMALLYEVEGMRGNDCLSTAALVHDIGKLYIPERILDKHGELTVLERDVMGLHPYFGYRLLSDFGVDEQIKRLVLYHHGMNPRTLLPVPEYCSPWIAEDARVLHTIDAFEALTTDRPYRRRMSVRQAAEFLDRQEGYHAGTLAFLAEQAADF